MPENIIILYLCTTNNDALYPPPHLNNPENQNFEKIKKMPGEIIILHKCTINKNGKYICIYVIYMYFTKYTENKVFSCDSPCL